MSTSNNNTEQEVSSIGVTFGDQFEGDGSMNVKFGLIVNSEYASERIKEANAKTGNHFESLNYSLLITFADCQKPEELKKQFDLLQSEENSNDGKSKPLHEQKLYKIAKKLLKEVIFKTHIVDKNVYLQISLQERISEKILEPFQILVESGLKNIAEKRNSIEGEVCLNLKAEQMIERFQQSNSILAVLLSQMRANLTLKLDKNLSGSIEEVISNIDESLLASPQVQFLKYFKNFEVNLAFNSTDSLPESIRQHILFGKVNTDNKINLEEESLLNGFLEHIPASVTAEVFVDEVAHLQASVTAPGLQKILVDFFSQAFKSFTN